MGLGKLLDRQESVPDHWCSNREL